MCLLLGLFICSTSVNGQNVSSYTIDDGQWGTPYAIDGSNLTVGTVIVGAYSGLSIQKAANVTLNSINCYNESSLFVASSTNIKIGQGSHFRAGSNVTLFVDASYFTGACPLPGARTVASVAEPVTDATSGISLPEAITVYPNPFTDAFTVAFDVREARTAKLTVYDLLGNRLALQPYDGRQVNGRGQITYDGSQLPAGVYVYQVQIGDTVQSGRIIKQ